MKIQQFYKHTLGNDNHTTEYYEYTSGNYEHIQLEKGAYTTANEKNTTEKTKIHLKIMDIQLESMKSQLKIKQL